MILNDHAKYKYKLASILKNTLKITAFVINNDKFQRLAYSHIK